MILGVDVGGTFTDAALFARGRVVTAKAPTTPGREHEGVMRVVGEALERAGAEPGEVEAFCHGTTVGTNALLEGKGSRTALVATAGFTDVIEIGRQRRPHLYRLRQPKPDPLVPPELRFGVEERVSAAGEILVPLRGEEVERVAQEVEGSAAEAVAVCLLFSYLMPDHERVLVEALRERLPELHVSASHRVLPRFREYERFSTTVVDAYLAPRLDAYLERLAGECEAIGLVRPLVMQSSGGLEGIEEAAGSGAWSVLSGPAGGAVGSALLATRSGSGEALGLDMGGTSCDVCLIESGRVASTDGREVEGRPIQLPMIDVHTVGAGGGSVAWRDRGGALKVGPRSAGADPGPACYGRGGREPTVTDANLLLGRLAPGARLAGGVELDGEAAAEAIGGLAERVGLGSVETAVGIVRLAELEMVRALRVVSVERGVDPRRLALLPFGGAGPIHASAIAEALGMSRILCPRAGGVLSALGMCASERRRDTVLTVMLSGKELTAQRVAERTRAMIESVESPPGAEPHLTYRLRYRGQAFELPVAAGSEPRVEELREGFEAEHERRYGFRDPEQELELVDVALAMRAPAEPPALEPGEAAPPSCTSREVHDGHAWRPTEVVSGLPAPGLTLRGPALLEMPETTVLAPEGWALTVDALGTVVMERDG